MKNLYGLDIDLTEEREQLMEGGWEKERMESMLLNINERDIVFDIGAEQGDMSVMLAKKAKGVVLFEPSPIMWAHIRDNFERNNLKPLDCFVGFASDTDLENPANLDYDDKMKKGYPMVAYDPLDNTRGFRHLRDQADATRQITIDTYVNRTGHIPTMITIDVEGSEYSVISGAMKTLEEHQPIVYLSVHHHLMYEMYGKWFHDLWFETLKPMGYKSHWLAHDHEDHFVFYTKTLKTINEIW